MIDPYEPPVWDSTVWAASQCHARLAQLERQMTETKALAFKMQQAALAAYAADDGHTVDLAWLVNMTTRLLELMQ